MVPYSPGYRTDAILSAKRVNCPRSDRLGFGKAFAKPGDLIVYDEHYTDGTHAHRTARVLATIDYAPALKHSPETKGWLLVLAISESLDHVYERWVDPQWVTRVIDCPRKLLSWFLQEQLPYPVDMMRRLDRHGSLTENYIHDVDNVARTFADVDKKRAEYEAQKEQRS